MVHIKIELTNRGKKQPNIMQELIEHEFIFELNDTCSDGKGDLLSV